MKKTLILLVFGVLISACSSSKEIQFNSLNQTPCTNESKITADNQFMGETVDNLSVYQQGPTVYASMDVRTYCNARVTFDLDKQESKIYLRLKNANDMTDDCVCITTVTTSFTNVEPGDYTVLVTNGGGNQLLSKKAVTVK